MRAIGYRKPSPPQGSDSLRSASPSNSSVSIAVGFSLRLALRSRQKIMAIRV